MKKLITLLIFFYGVIGYCQTDTTSFFDIVTETKYEPTVLKETEFITTDTILFNITADSLHWTTDVWIRIDSSYRNAKTYIIREKQERMNDQGIKQKKRRKIKYVNTTRVRRKVRN